MKTAKTKNRIVAHETLEECKIENQHFLSNKELLKKEIEKKAYELYAGRGYSPGRDLDDWLEAEKAVILDGDSTK